MGLRGTDPPKRTGLLPVGSLDLALVIIGRQALLIEDRGSHVRLPSLVLDMAAGLRAACETS